MGHKAISICYALHQISDAIEGMRLLAEVSEGDGFCRPEDEKRSHRRWRHFLVSSVCTSKMCCASCAVSLRSAPRGHPRVRHPRSKTRRAKIYSSWQMHLH